jgi:hypothetical protein
MCENLAPTADGARLWPANSAVSRNDDFLWTMKADKGCRECGSLTCDVSHEQDRGLSMSRHIPPYRRFTQWPSPLCGSNAGSNWHAESERPEIRANWPDLANGVFRYELSVLNGRGFGAVSDDERQLLARITRLRATRFVAARPITQFAKAGPSDTAALSYAMAANRFNARIRSDRSMWARSTARRSTAIVLS